MDPLAVSIQNWSTKYMLDRIPENFVGAGEKLAQAPGAPEAEWLNGSFEPLGNGRFRIVMAGLGGSGYVTLRKGGTATIRGAVQPARINLDSLRIKDGKPQKITFASIADVKAGTPSVPLVATSDAGLPVQFYVEFGPAIIREDGTWAVGLFNLGDAEATVSVKWSDLGLKASPQAVRDLWRQKDLGSQAEGYAITVASHGAELIRVGNPGK